MSQICKHNFVPSAIHGYNQCTICGTYNLIVDPGTEVYTTNYWSHENNRSTLQEQVGNFTMPINGRTKLEVLTTHIGHGDSALEIACAPGIVLNHLAQTHVMAYGIEADPNTFGEIARIAGEKNVRLWQGFFPYDFFGLNSDQFDTIVASDVLEHIDDPEYFVAHCHKIMKPNGKLIVMTPILQPGIEMPERMWNTDEHIWVFSMQHIVQIFTKYFAKVETENWIPGHEVIVGTGKRGI